MPRLPWAQFKVARLENRLLSLLLPICSTLSSSRNELRWLREHAMAVARRHEGRPGTHWSHLLLGYCRTRRSGKPLQYIIGDQPFGDLNIRCRPGVLIPRPETESYTTHLAELIVRFWSSKGTDAAVDLPSLRILDLCTGTGCIPLLLYSLLSRHTERVRCVGVDLSPRAVATARENLWCNVRQGDLKSKAQRDVKFLRANVLRDSEFGSRNSNSTLGLMKALDEVDEPAHFDILISNPPYISPQDFLTTTSRSVRNWEPKLALVPPIQIRTLNTSTPIEGNMAVPVEDTFYPGLLATAKTVNAKLVLLEVADMAQAIRVASIARKSGDWEDVAIWRDWLSARGRSPIETVEVDGHPVEVKGEGYGRAVLCWKSVGGSWIAPR